MNDFYHDKNRNRKIVKRKSNLKYLMNGEHRVAIDPPHLPLSHLVTLDETLVVCEHILGTAF